MRISEVSAETGVPLSTLKMYQREGLLPPGEKSQPNQAFYGPEHVQRVRMVTALIRTGGLSVAAAREVVDALGADTPLLHTLAVAQQAATRDLDPSSVAEGAVATIDEVTAGWLCSPDCTGRLGAAAAVAAFEAAGQSAPTGWYSRLAQAALLVAEADLDLIDTRETRADKAETVVLGTVLGDALFAGLRRAAQEHLSNVRYAPQSKEPT